MSRDQKTIIAIVVVLVLVCAVVVCLCALLAGSVGTLKVLSQTRKPIRSFERHWRVTVEPRYPRRLPEGMRFAALVIEVTEDAPADLAGLEPGDLIVALDGVTIEQSIDLAEMISGYKPGDRVDLTVRRAGAENEIQVRLGEHPTIKGRPYLGVTYQAVPMSPE